MSETLLRRPLPREVAREFARCDDQEPPRDARGEPRIAVEIGGVALRLHADHGADAASRRALLDDLRRAVAALVEAERAR